MSLGSVLIVSGPPGAGKSGVARRLAQAWPRARAVYLHTDDFYANIVKGFVDPWRAEAHGQNTVVVDTIVACAEQYTRGGFDVVVDGVFGPWFLEPWLALARRGLAIQYVVLRPDETTTLARGTSRAVPGAMVDAAVISAMCRQFAELGSYEAHALDTTTLSLDETVAAILVTMAQDGWLLRANATDD